MLLVSSAYGYSVIEVTAESSEVIRQHAPYAWAAWLMPLTAALFATWAVYCVRCSIQDEGWAWIDCLLIGEIPLTCVWQRLLTVESEPIVLLFEVGIYLGLLSVATLWLVFGQARVSLRFLVVAVIVSIGLRYGLAVPRDEQLEAPVVVVTLAAAVGVYGLGRTLRCFGLKCRNQLLPSPKTSPPRVTVAGFFWAAPAIALLAVEARTLRPIHVVDGVANLFGMASVGAAFSLFLMIAAMLALSPSKRLHAFASVFCGAVAVAAVALPWSMFVYGFRLDHFVGTVGSTILPSAMLIPFTAMFILLLPYRLRGWRFVWRSASPSNSNVASEKEPR